MTYQGVGSPTPAEQFVFPEVLATPQASQDVTLRPLVVPPAQGPIVEYSAFPGTIAPSEAAGVPMYASYPQSGQTIAPPPPQPPQRKHLNAAAIVAICLTAVLILLGSGGLVYDLVYYQPYMAQVNATATSNVQATSTTNIANAQITSIAATDEAQASATAQAYQDLYRRVTSGTPVLNDALKAQGSGQWDTGVNQDKSSCTFKNDGYHVSQPNAGFFLPCYESSMNFTNFALQVDMTIVNGNFGGLVFRADPSTGREYLFTINAYGAYSFYIYTGNQASQSSTILNSTTEYMDSSGSTEITLVVQESTFSFYLNGHFVDSTTNTALTSGLIGLVADNHNQPTEVTFSNTKIWIL